MFAPVLEKFPQSADDDALYDFFMRGDEIGVRMELVDSGFTYEAAPGQRHQELMVEIYASTGRQTQSTSGCRCHRLIDIAIRLPDGLVKRPDLAIFCERPPEEEGFVHSVPRAVIEITSPGYEDKDLVYGPPIYIRNGVEDILVLDRRTNEVHHWTGSTHQVVPSPTTFQLRCGCTVTV